MSGQNQNFKGIHQFSEESICLLKDTTGCRHWGSNPGPLNSESNVLPLCHSIHPTQISQTHLPCIQETSHGSSFMIDKHY